MPLFALTIFVSAFLLFLVQPLMAKQILPWFGGAANVWTACLVFYQVVLLLGYLYAHASNRWLKPRAQAIVHLLLLGAALLALPILVPMRWKPTGSEEPTLRIVTVLLFTIGLPYLMLSTTGPLLQAWAARRVGGARVYRLFAVSNVASLLALLGYPVAIEPWLTTHRQALGWSAGFVLFVGLCAATALRSRRDAFASAEAGEDAPSSAAPPPAWTQYVVWLLLSTLGAALLVATTNHLTQDVASIPLLWLVPLSFYLITFIICFEREGAYRRIVILPLLGVALPTMAWGLSTQKILYNLKLAGPLYTIGMFLCCMFCHGELSRLRPATRHLTAFYLMISLGGALGGVLCGVVAPRLLSADYEFGFFLCLIALMGVAALRRARIWFILPAVASLLVTGYMYKRYVDYVFLDTRELRRSFFGVLSTTERMQMPLDERKRRLLHGTIIHGAQAVDPSQRQKPTMYYGPDSGVGLAIAHAPHPKRVGVIGLGAGTLAVYGQPGDVFRFYEIDTKVVELARSEFTFLQDSKAAIELELGDARLRLEREPPQRFDVLVVDAFSGDAIPVHLLTVEAVGIYLRHLQPQGVLALHVSNRALKLAPVVAEIAAVHKLSARLIVDEAQNTDFLESDWVLLARDAVTLAYLDLNKAASALPRMPGLGPWTDDFSSLLRVLK